MVGIWFAVLVWAPVPVSGAASVCANEQLRAESLVNPRSEVPFSEGLPDCRAYELVSPAYQQGALLTGASEKAGEQDFIADDGRGVAGSSFGVFGGAGAAETVAGEAYVFKRDGSGWLAEGIGPPAGPPAEGYVRNFLRLGTTISPAGAVSGDFTLELFSGYARVGEPVMTQNLYRREGDGSFVEVGPALSREVVERADREEGGTALELGRGAVQLVGVSADLSDVLFTVAGPGGTLPGTTKESPNWLWLPGDTSQKRVSKENWGSLYEYRGVGNTEPELVGVNSEGELIGECGVELGSAGVPLSESGREHDGYNAVSRDGGTVFFTVEHAEESEECTGRQPMVNELYARVGGNAPVDVSEPPLMGVEGRVCTGTCEEDELEEAKRGEAIFQGASEDGSRVFFLTSQPLVNEDENEEQDLYEEELSGGVVKRLALVSRDSTGKAAGARGVARVAESGERVYFVSGGVLVEKRSSEEVERSGLKESYANPIPKADNLYVYDAAQNRVAFVTVLGGGDENDWRVADKRPVAATPDGEYLLFASEEALTTDDETPGVKQLFRYDAGTGNVVRVSVCSPEVVKCPVKPASFPLQNFETSGVLPAPKAISDDGAFVFFESAAALTDGAVSGPEPAYNNVYEYHDGNVYLISEGEDTSHVQLDRSSVRLLGTDGSGQDVFFTTEMPLVGQDTNGGVDVYDARAGGGFPAPVTPAWCEGEGCLGGPPGASSLLAAGSEALPGEENLRYEPPQPKPKQKRLTRAQKLKRALRRCAKKRQRKRRRVCRARAKRHYAHSGKRRRSGRSGRRTGR